jgi:hypothetical protein
MCVTQCCSRAQSHIAGQRLFTDRYICIYIHDALARRTNSRAGNKAMHRLLTGLAYQAPGPQSAARMMTAIGRMAVSIPTADMGGDEGGGEADACMGPDGELDGGGIGGGRLAKRQKIGTCFNPESSAGRASESVKVSPAVKKSCSRGLEMRSTEGDGGGEESAVWGRRLHEFVSQEEVAVLEEFERHLFVEAAGEEAGAVVEAAGAGAGAVGQGGAGSDQHGCAEGGGCESVKVACLPLRIVSSMSSCSHAPGAAADGRGGSKGAVRECASKRKTRTSGAQGRGLRQGERENVDATPEILFRIGWVSSLRPMVPGLPFLLFLFLCPPPLCPPLPLSLSLIPIFRVHLSLTRIPSTPVCLACLSHASLSISITVRY